MSYREYSSGTHLRRQHRNGINLRLVRLDPWAPVDRSDDGPVWEARALKAMEVFRALPISDEAYWRFQDGFDVDRLTWKQIFYVYRIAAYTYRFDTSADLLVETGLVAA